MNNTTKQPGYLTDHLIGSTKTELLNFAHLTGQRARNWMIPQDRVIQVRELAIIRFYISERMGLSMGETFDLLKAVDRFYDAGVSGEGRPQ